MQLMRVRDYATAKFVAQGVQRYNGVMLRPERVLTRPHYVVTSRGKIAGWIGVEDRGRKVFELCHLSVLPKYRRQGLAQSAFALALAMIRASNGRYTYSRIVRSNYPSICLVRKFGFRQTKGGRVLVFGRTV